MDKNPDYVPQRQLPPGGGNAAHAACNASQGDGTDASQGDGQASGPSHWAWPFQDMVGGSPTEKLADGTTLQMAGTQLAKTGPMGGIFCLGLQMGRNMEKQDSTIKGLKRRIELLEVSDNSAAYRGKIMEA